MPLREYSFVEFKLRTCAASPVKGRRHVLLGLAPDARKKERKKRLVLDVDATGTGAGGDL